MPPARASTAPAATPASDGARWTTFEAKTSRLRPDQRTQLTEVARRLTAAKAGAGERITDNTLIRVAVDLLLSRQNELAGTTEQELRASMGVDFGTS